MAKLNQLPGTDEQSMSLHDIISDIKDDQFSDLNPEDIPNSEISDISETEVGKEEEMLETLEKEKDIHAKIMMAKEQSDLVAEKNHHFMSDFVKTYQTNPNDAKRNYYLLKLKFDVKESRGKVEL
jgi:predicted RNA-binding protein with EMAP domain